MSDDAQLVDLAVEDGVALVTLNRPGQLNAVNNALRLQMYDVVEQIEEDPEIRVAIITGSGERAFCAGADLKEMGGKRAKRLGAPGGFAGLARHPRSKPYIAAVNGLAYGGGFEIVLSCDLVVAVRTATFGLPEVLRGIVAGGGGAVRLAQRVPGAIARRVLLTGQPISAEEAYRWGLVNELVEPGEAVAAARALAIQICAAAPQAIMATLAISRTADELLEGVGWQVNDAAVAGVLRTDDSREGPRAFVERRPPVWTGS